jgi:hypothetical protein
MNKDEVDIIILGGGIAGYAAAMALDNKDVLLIEKNSALGGATTQANVGTLCGLYYQQESPQLVPHSFCKKFVGELFIHDNQAKLLSLPGNLHVISYEWSNLQRMMMKHLDLKKTKLMFNASVKTIKSSTNEIQSITVDVNGTIKTISCRRIIDCTGTGYAAQLIHHKMIQADSYQSAAQVFRLKGVAQSNEYSLNMALKRVMMKNTSQNELPASYAGLSVVPGSLRNDHVDLKLPLAEIINDSDGQQTRLQKELDHNLGKVLSSIQEIESLRDAELDIIFPSPGIRIQQRPMGQTVLTESDVLTCKKSDDGVAIGTWPVEEWDYKGKVSMEYLQENDGYFIPAKTLISPQYANLFFAGKGISADSKAIASARVTGTCLQTGFAAGLLAGCETPDQQRQAVSKLHTMISSRS